MQRPLASRPPITRHTRDLTNQLAVVEAELVKASRLASARSSTGVWSIG